MDEKHPIVGGIVMQKEFDNLYLNGPAGSMLIDMSDKLTRKLAMIIENKCFGVRAIDAAEKYGFSRSRFYQLRDAYEKGGSEALLENKRGPTKNSTRTDTVVNQIIRYRFLDPDASVAVITQKMKQVGFKVSQRSVERTITEYGLQKKTLFLKSSERIKRIGGASHKTSNKKM